MQGDVLEERFDLSVCGGEKKQVLRRLGPADNQPKTWSVTPPPGVPYDVHEYSLYGALIERSNAIFYASRTSSATRITCGIMALTPVERQLYFTIVEDNRNPFYRGKLGRWAVFADPKMGDWDIVLSYDVGCCGWSNLLKIVV